MAVITACVAARRSREWTRALFLDPKNAISDWFFYDYQGKKRSPRAAERQFNRAWDRAEARVAQDPTFRDRASAYEHVAAVLDAIEGQTWSGVGGWSDLTLLIVHVGLAAKAGGPRYGASVREVAERSGLTTSSVVRGHRRLRKRGWLRLKKQGRGEVASVWQLQVPKGATKPDHSVPAYPPGGEECAGSFASDHDAFRCPGLGKAKYFVYRQLTRESIETREIAARLGKTARTIQHHLRGLSRFGLAKRLPAGWVRGDASLDDVAAQLGVAGVGKRQREAHARQRDAYRAAQKDARTRRSGRRTVRRQGATKRM